MRIDVIDIIKGIAIIMIVNVHLISGQFFPIGCTYHVIAFFFTVGLLHGMSEKWNQKTSASLVKKRLKQLGRPYLFLSVSYIIMHMIINIVRGDSLVNIVITESFLKTITLRGIGTLWFLPVLFFGETIFFVAKRKRINSLMLVIIAVFVVFITSYLNNIGLFHRLDTFKLSTIPLSSPLKITISSLMASGFIGLGHWLYSMINCIFQDSYFTSSKRLICLIVVCLFSFIIDFSLISVYCGDLHKMDINNPVVYIICSVTGLSFVTSLALIIKRTSKLLSNIMKYFGQNSLIIMTTHTEYYINSIANFIIVLFISMLGITFPTKILSGAVLLVILFLEFGLIYVVKHSVLKYIFNEKNGGKP